MDFRARFTLRHRGLNRLRGLLKRDGSQVDQKLFSLMPLVPRQQIKAPANLHNCPINLPHSLLALLG